MAYCYMLRQPLTGEKKRLQHSTAEYLECMRMYCQENALNIQELFKDEDDEKVGSVPEYTFLYLIRKKFQGQADFSMDQVRSIANFFKVPDGSIWYSRLHLLMESDDTVSDQVRNACFKASSSSGIPSTPLFPATQETTSFDNLSPPTFKFGLPPVATPYPQDRMSRARFRHTSTELKTNFSFATKEDPNPSTAPSAALATGFTFGRVIVNGNQTATSSQNGSAFGCVSAPNSVKTEEAAGSSLPAFTNGLSQQSTKTVPKILGGSSSVMMGTSACSNVSSSEITGLGRGLLGAGDASNDCGGASTKTCGDDADYDYGLE